MMLLIVILHFVIKKKINTHNNTADPKTVQILPLGAFAPLAPLSP